VVKLSQFSIHILENDSVIKRKILSSTANYLNKNVPKIVDSISKDVRAMTTTFLKDTDTYKSLINGELAGSFGLPQNTRHYDVDQILSTIATNMEVKYEKTRYSGGKFSTFLKVGAVLRDFSDILALSESRVITDEGTILEWLRWLLTAGDKIIISEHQVRLRHGRGRSGLGIMIQSNAGGWRVPPEYAGTMTNNWLTKSLLNNSNKYLLLVEDIIEKAFSRIL
jgi:hypothetical protein